MTNLYVLRIPFSAICFWSTRKQILAPPLALAMKSRFRLNVGTSVLFQVLVGRDLVSPPPFAEILDPPLVVWNKSIFF